MDNSQVNGVHFVGSVPVPTEEDCYRILCNALPSRLKRIPDGEPGQRGNFAGWQMNVFKHEPRVINQQFRPNAPNDFSIEEANDIVKAFVNMETRYDDYALESYAKFKKLKAEGVVPPHVRFQVCLPTPLTVVYLLVHTQLTSRIEPEYEKAMLRTLERIQDKIPHEELSIQWDAPLEMGMLEQANFYGNREIKPWFEPVFDGIVDSMKRMVDAVEEDVEVGIHLCYGKVDCALIRRSFTNGVGDLGHAHFMEPKSTLTMITLVNAIFDRCQRRVDYLHLPVPKARTDEQYFSAIEQLKLGDTELILGLVHYDDLDGTKARIAAASKYVTSFAVATECGLGRTPLEQLDNIFSILSAVSTPTAP